MKPINNLIALALFGSILSSCGGDYRREAQGQFGAVIVVMDSTRWESAVADAIRDVYGAKLEYILGYETRFDLTFRDFRTNDQLENIRFNKNIIIASPIDDQTNVGQWIRAMLSDEVEERVRDGSAFAFPLENEWYRNQWAMILTSSSDSLLALKIRGSERSLAQNLIRKELARWTEDIYERGEQLEISDSLWANAGWKIRVQHDYRINVDTTYTVDGKTNHFLTLQRLLSDNSRRFWIWWEEGVSDIDYLDEQWINAKRDSLWEMWVRGTRDSSYVTTDYRDRHVALETENFTLNGDIAYESLGWWRMTGDAMGGPFTSLTVYDDESRRLFMMGFVQFAPMYDKRRFVRQFRAIQRTFESDSTWNSNNRVAIN